ncbi:hypothetical protein DPMN_128712 [Dreissena polymorpha]|uniref:VWFA domain-containing protein n=1 Tax=Dreissena polymorpha TaxID=45954 RepID=A0A9D4H3H4_DREPO|nr:hypothetical protein DPMN_128712 [Dreissena polymorpha]
MTALLLNKPDTIIWDLDGHYTKTEMINHLQIIQKEVWPPNPDPLVGLTTYIRHANDVSFGNRHDKADVVILLTTGNTADHSGFWLASMSKGYILDKLHGLSNNVIVFGIGHRVQRSNLREIATDDEHLFLLNNVYELPSYAERAKRHICV